MLSENIRRLRKARGLSQEELAARLNVVRQTVSKWEQGLSVPDADLLMAAAEALETSVSALLGETVDEPKPDEMKAIAEKLEIINLQLARRKEIRRKMLHGGFIGLAMLIAAALVLLYFMGSPYLTWDFSDPELAVAGTMLHAFEFCFVRVAPFAWIGAIVGAVLTRKKQ